MKSIKAQKAKQQQYYADRGQEPSLESTPDPRLYKANPLLIINQEKFREEVEALKGKSFDEKAKLKRNLLARYNDQINAYIRTGQGQNELFAYAVQWCFDVGDLDRYIRMTDIAMNRGVKPVVRSNKTFEECLRYDILDWADAQHKENNSCEPYLSLVMTRIKDWSKIPEKQRSSFWYLKFHNTLRFETIEDAIAVGKVALKEHDAQVKTKLRDLFLERWGKEKGKEKWDEFIKGE